MRLQIQRGLVFINLTITISARALFPLSGTVWFSMVQSAIFSIYTVKKVQNNHTVPYIFWSPFCRDTKQSQTGPKREELTFHTLQPLTASRQKAIFKC